MDDNDTSQLVNDLDMDISLSATSKSSLFTIDRLLSSFDQWEKVKKSKQDSKTNIICLRNKGEIFGSFYAMREIKMGEQLSKDYSPDYWLFKLLRKWKQDIEKHSLEEIGRCLRIMNKKFKNSEYINYDSEFLMESIQKIYERKQHEYVNVNVIQVIQNIMDKVCHMKNGKAKKEEKKLKLKLKNLGKIKNNNNRMRMEYPTRLINPKRAHEYMENKYVVNKRNRYGYCWE